MGPDQYKVLVFYGPGGHGKTSLQENFRRFLTQRQITHAWLNFGIVGGAGDPRRPEIALKQLRVQLGQQLAQPFPLFDLAFRRYHELTNPGRSFQQTYPELVSDSHILQWLLAGTDVVAGGLATFFYQNVVKPAGAKAMLWYETRGSHLIERIEELQPTELAERLIACFGADLDRIVWGEIPTGDSSTGRFKYHQIVVLLDTYEHLFQNYSVRGIAARHIDRWVRTLVDETPGVLYVVTGRDELQWDDVDNHFARVVQHHRLDGLTRRDGDTALSGAKVLEDDIRARMLDGASIDADEVHPFYLKVQTKHYHRRKGNGEALRLEDFGGNPMEILSRFLEHLGSDERRVLEFLSLSRRIDVDVYTFLKDRFFASYGVTYEEMLDRSVLYASSSEGEEESDGRSHPVDAELRMHALLRRYLADRIKDKELPLFRRVHDALFVRYDTILADTPVTRVGPEHEQVFLEAAYHLREHAPNRLTEWCVERVPLLHSAHRYHAAEPILHECIKHLKESGHRALGLFDAVGETGEERESGLFPGDDTERDAVLRTFARLSSLLADGQKEHLDLHAAEKGYRTALSMVGRIRAREPFELLNAKFQLAGVLAERHQFDDALGLYYSALEHATATEEHRIPINFTWEIGKFLLTRGKYLEAEALLYVTWQVCRRYEPGTATEHLAAHDLARCLASQGRASEALPLAEGTYCFYRDNWGPEHPFTAITRAAIARCLSVLGRMDEAEFHFLEALAVVKSTFGPKHMDVAAILLRYAVALLESGKWTSLFRARDACEEARQIIEAAVGNEHVLMGRSLKVMGDVCTAEGLSVLACEHYRAALPVLERTAGYSHPFTRECIAGLEASLCIQGLEEEAAHYRQHLADVDTLVPVDIRFDRFDTRLADPQEAGWLVGLCGKRTSLPPSAEGLEVTVAELPFHPDHQLCRFSFTGMKPRLSKYAIVSKSNVLNGKDPEAYALDFSANPIYELAYKSPPVLTEKTVGLYARFFFDAVRGKHGRFWVVEREDEVHWQPGVPDEVLFRQRERLRDAVESISILEKRDDGYTLSIMQTFKDTLFRSQVDIPTFHADKDQIRMHDESIVLFEFCMGLDKLHPASRRLR